uniref:Pentatricopeptide repeat-containing protein At5g56310 n=1 Tax=Anthurium amnicola TaxID=1678845 RepID=A0A1D1ZA88_9ARAE
MLRRCVPSRFLLSSGSLPPSSALRDARTQALSAESSSSLFSLLDRCSSLGHISQTHGFMVPRGLDRDNHLLSKFVDGCSALGFKDYACSVFAHVERPDLYLYNTVIKALSQTELAGDAIALYGRIQVTGFRPDTYSFPFVLKAVAHLSQLAVGREIHGQIVRMGFSSDVHVATALIHMYSVCEDIRDARHLFDEVHHRDLISWNAMVAGYAKHGDMEGARALFEQMPERNVISWTAVVAGYVQSNRPMEAINVFRRMQLEEHVEPDEIALLAALSACAHLGALQLGEWIHSYIDKRGLCKIVPLMNALVDMYAKSGNIGKAVEVFESMSHTSVVSWTTAIAGLASHGLSFEALEMFRRMEKANQKPNDVTFLAILSACSHVGLVDMGRYYFDSMCSRHHIKPRIEHYGCMVDLLGRAGFLREACELVEDMPFDANGAIWGSLLAAARNHGDAELGEAALRHLVELEPHNSGNYSLLLNIYASQGKWDDVGKMRKLMRDQGLKKIPGGSSVEVNGTVHEFTARDTSHPDLGRIHEVLKDINGHSKMLGCVPRDC